MFYHRILGRCSPVFGQKEEELKQKASYFEISTKIPFGRKF
jgi:hypothetical protein